MPFFESVPYGFQILLEIDRPSFLIFGGVLVGLAAAMGFWHHQSWKLARDDRHLSDIEREFAWRQCRRRSQASGMIGLVGLGIMAGPFLPRDEVIFTLYIFGMIALVLWIMLMAIGDMLATRLHFRNLRRKEFDEKLAKRKAEKKQEETSTNSDEEENT